MGPEERDRWTNEVLDEVFEALAASKRVREMVVFRGARVLALRLPGMGRQSLDIDCSLLESTVREAASLRDLGTALRGSIEDAIRAHFSTQRIVRFEFESIRVRGNPPKGNHPAGLDGFKISLHVGDRTRPDVRGFPGLKIDVAAPETLGPKSVTELKIKNHSVWAYREERLVGEKLRAYLQRLPEFRSKSSDEKSPRRSVRAIRIKDIFDIASVERVFPFETKPLFWGQAIEEFRIACESRGVDCSGLVTFEQRLSHAREQYEADEGLQSLIPFTKAWPVIVKVARRMESEGIVPFQFELPPTIER